MSNRRLCIALVALATLVNSRQLYAQEKSSAGQNGFYTGYSLLSGSFNNYAEFSGNPMNGWDSAVTVHATGSLSVTIGVLGFYGTNLGASQIEHSVLVGPQWSWHGAKESLFVHGLGGLGFINSGAIPFDHSSPKSNVTLALMAGGGLDTPFSRHLAWRVEGDYLRSQYSSSSDQIHNLRGNFAHFSTGLVIRF